MGAQNSSFSVGDVIRIEEWDESLIVEKIDPMGSFLRITGRSTESSEKVIRLKKDKI